MREKVGKFEQTKPETPKNAEKPEIEEKKTQKEEKIEEKKPKEIEDKKPKEEAPQKQIA